MYVKLEKKDLFDSSVNEEYLKQLAQEINGYSGADIAALYTESAMSAIRKQLQVDEKGKATMRKSIDEIVITKDDFEFAKEVLKLAGKDVELKPVTTKDAELSVARPTYAVLDNFILRIIDMYDMPDWKASLEEYFKG